MLKVPDNQSYPIAFVGLQLEGAVRLVRSIWIVLIGKMSKCSLKSTLEREVSKSTSQGTYYVEISMG